MKKDINFVTTSSQVYAAMTSLINMNNVVDLAIHIGAKQDVAFLTTIQQAYHYATQTEINVDHIDTRLHDVLAVLLMEAKLAYDYFYKGANDHLIFQLMIAANQQATAQLMSLS